MQNPVRKDATLESLGSINIVTKTPGVEINTVETDKQENKTKVVDLNRMTNFPLNA